jgi:hypothetical protein
MWGSLALPTTIKEVLVTTISYNNAVAFHVVAFGKSLVIDAKAGPTLAEHFLLNYERDDRRESLTQASLPS